MTISHVASDGWSAGLFNRTVEPPPTISAGDMMVLIVGVKPYDATISTPSGWTAIGAQAANGTTASGVDTGSVAWKAFYKIAGASEGTVSLSGSGITNGAGCIVGFAKTKQSWVTPTIYNGGDTSSGTGYSATASGSSGNITAGDMLQAAIFLPGDNATIGSKAIAASGLTMGTVFTDPSSDVASASGDDLAASACYAVVSSGTASADATVTATLSAAQTGGSPLIRLREIDTYLYWVVYTAEKGAPSATQVKAGTDVNDDAAVDSGSELAPTTTTDPFTFASGATGLSPATQYKVAVVWSDGTDDSSVAVSAAWATNNEGSFAVQESGSDTAVFAGLTKVVGSFSLTESGSDTPAFAGAVYVSGAFSVQESGTDTAEFTSSTSTFGSFAVQESGPDTASFAGAVYISGSFAVTESGSDTAWFSEAEGNYGSFTLVESGGDTAAFSGLGQIIAADVALDNTWTAAANADTTWGHEYYTPLNWTREIRRG